VRFWPPSIGQLLGGQFSARPGAYLNAAQPYLPLRGDGGLAQDADLRHLGMKGSSIQAGWTSICPVVVGYGGKTQFFDQHASTFSPDTKVRESWIKLSVSR